MIMDGYEFQSTRPLRGGTSVLTGPSLNRLISIHPPLAGRDEDELYHSCKRDISIHPPLAGRDKGLLVTLRFADISIHPPLAGRDTARDIKGDLLYISIHPPLAGRDLLPGKLGIQRPDFNPPAPCGAGLRRCSGCAACADFNPPAPCGAGPGRAEQRVETAPFQSTRPLRGGTCKRAAGREILRISIHPPLAGRDYSAP